MALTRFRKSQAPEVFVFFKQVDPASMGDPGPELSKVLTFRRELEETRSVLYRVFVEPHDFQREVDRHLRAFAKNELPTVDVERERLPLPLELIEQVERAKAEGHRLAEEAEARARTQTDAAHAAMERAAVYQARAEALASELATQAARAASTGHIEEERQLFAKAIAGTQSIDVLGLASEFYYRIGDLSSAEELVQRWLAISENAASRATAAALHNLGTICSARGDLA